MDNQWQILKTTVGFFLLMTLHVTVFSQHKDFSKTKSGLKIGIQSFSFKEFDFYTALDKYDTLGIRNIEAYSFMKIGGELNGNLDINMSAKDRTIVANWLKKRNMRMVNYFVVNMRSNEDWIKLFEFAKFFKIKTLVGEPNLKIIPFLSSLCDKYKINFAIHNHPEPSPYWNPKKVLEVIKGYGPRLGACADIGHWIRSGLDPLESLKTLEGRILATHMKDLNEKGKNGHNVVFGEGVSNVSGLIAELKRQKYKGIITIEYEYNWFNNVPDIAKCISYLRAL